MFRFLAKQAKPPIKFLIVTTSMINGDTLLEPFVDDVQRS